MSELERGFIARADGPNEPTLYGGHGTAVSLGLVVPIALGSTSPPAGEAAPAKAEVPCRRGPVVKAKPGMPRRCTD